MNNKDKTTSRESFVFYRSFYDSIKVLPDEVQQALFRAVIEYGLDQVVPSFQGVPYQPFVEAIFAGIRPQLDANLKRFLNGCKGGEYGKLGGNPNFAKGRPNPYYSKDNPKDNPDITPNDNGNDNVNVNEDKIKPQPRHSSLSLPNADKEFADTWIELLSQPKWKNKTRFALQTALNQLSNYHVRFAVMLMQNAIAGNYQGVVFNDTPAKYQQWLKSNPPATRREDGQDDGITDTKNLYKY